MADPFLEIARREGVGALLDEPVAGDNAAPMSVGELAGKLKRVVESEFGFVRLRGEISGYKRVASGHAYLSLKDDSAVIDGDEYTLAEPWDGRSLTDWAAEVLRRLWRT